MRKYQAIIIKTKSYVMGLTWQQVKNLTRQQRIDNASPALVVDPPLPEDATIQQKRNRVDEVADINGKFSILRKYYRQAWIDVQHEDLRVNTILPALITARDAVAADLEPLGLSTATATKIVKQVLREMLEVD